MTAQELVEEVFALICAGQLQASAEVDFQLPDGKECEGEVGFGVYELEVNGLHNNYLTLKAR